VLVLDTRETLVCRRDPACQQAARCVYIGLMRLHLRGRFQDHIVNYKSGRGMDYYHDVHDWMGGYPYESSSADEVDALMSALGFEHVRASHSHCRMGCSARVAMSTSIVA